MSPNETKLYNFAFLVKKLQFESDADCHAQDEVTASVKFLRYHEQKLFDPVSRPPSDILRLNAGKTFTFGLSRAAALDLAKRFVVDLSLHQADQRLSDVQVDVTKKFRDVFKSSCRGNSMTQVRKTVQFNDSEGKCIASMEMIMRLSPSGPTIVNEFSLDGNPDRNYVMTTNGSCKCPKVSELKFPCKKPDNDDEGEWDIIGAEYENGQKIAIKYKRNYYEFNPEGYDKPCEKLSTGMTRSEEKLNVRMLSLMDEMHKIIAANTTTAN